MCFIHLSQPVSCFWDYFFAALETLREEAVATGHCRDTKQRRECGFSERSGRFFKGENENRSVGMFLVCFCRVWYNNEIQKKSITEEQLSERAPSIHVCGCFLLFLVRSKSKHQATCLADLFRHTFHVISGARSFILDMYSYSYPYALSWSNVASMMLRHILKDPLILLVQLYVLLAFLVQEVLEGYSIVPKKSRTLCQTIRACPEAKRTSQTHLLSRCLGRLSSSYRRARCSPLQETFDLGCFLGIHRPAAKRSWLLVQTNSFLRSHCSGF